ncbi:porin family protein [Halocola ammonii]
MKNIISLSALFIFLTATAFGQSDDYQKFKFGIKLSPNISWMKPKNNDISSEGSLLKAGFGLIADIHFTENYAIGTGVNVSANGGELSFYDVWSEGNTKYVVRRNRTYNLQNIEVPLTLKMRTNEIGYITYWGQFGVGLGAHISGRADDEMGFLYELDPETSNENDDFYVTSRRDGRTEEDINIMDEDDLRLFRLSFIVGAGIEYNLGGTTSIVAGLTFNNGLLNILKGDFVVESDQGNPVFDGVDSNTGQLKNANMTDLDAINNYFELNLGIMF